MKIEYKWLVTIVVVVVVIIAVAAYLLGEDEDNGDGIKRHPDKYPGTISIENFELNSEEYETWMKGTITIYESGDGFEGDIALQYYHDPEDPHFLRVLTYSSFYMSELRTDHDHSCSNVVTQSWALGSTLYIDRFECSQRDDGAIAIHIVSTPYPYLDPEQTQSKFVLSLGDGINTLSLFVDLPRTEDGNTETSTETV